MAIIFFFLHGCIYTKVAASTSSMNLCLSYHATWIVLHTCLHYSISIKTVNRLCRAGPRGRARGRTTLGVHPLSWLLSNNRLEKVPFVSVPHTSSNRLLLSNQDKGCTPSVAHSLALSLGPALHNLCNAFWILPVN